jgi:hypothetical protein
MEAFAHHEDPLLLKVEVNGKAYGVWPNWGEHNDFRENKSRYPEVLAVLRGEPSDTLKNPRKGTSTLESPSEREVESEVEVEVESMSECLTDETTRVSGQEEPNPKPQATEIQLAKTLYRLLDKPKEHAVNSWHKEVAVLLTEHSTEEIASVMDFAVKDNLYDELRANQDSGWAFFAPAGYSKTTCSYALWKNAVFANLRKLWELDPTRCELWSSEFIPHPNGGYNQRGPNKLRVPRIFVWRKSVPDLLQQHFDRMNMGEGEDATFVPKPDISVENIEKAVRAGMKPRVFLEEIDKIKPSEYAINQLFRIFDALDRHKGQIVLDTNFSKEQFKNVFGEMITRRVKENCIVKEFGF